MFNLSDEQLVYQLFNRLSFQRFAGLLNSNKISDWTTFCTNRAPLLKSGASEILLEAVKRQLKKKATARVVHQMIDAGWTKKTGNAFFSYNLF